MLEILFTPDEKINWLGDKFKPFRENRHLFLSKKVKYTFCERSKGYFSKLKKRNIQFNHYVNDYSLFNVLIHDSLDSGKISLNWVYNEVDQFFARGIDNNIIFTEVTKYKRVDLEKTLSTEYLRNL